jgi:hypothetical protein
MDNTTSSLYQTYDNFCLPHASLRRALLHPEPTKGTGSAKEWRPCTPAMAAGLSDRVWTLREVLLYRVPPWLIYDTAPEGLGTLLICPTNTVGWVRCPPTPGEKCAGGDSDPRGPGLDRPPAHRLTRRTRLQCSPHCGLAAIGTGGARTGLSLAGGRHSTA